MNVHPLTEAEKQGGHSVKRACELLGVSRSAFYACRSGVPGPARCATGSGPSAQPGRDGQRCGRRRVLWLMRALGLTGPNWRHRWKTTIAGPNAEARPGLIGRNFTAARPGTKLVGDIIS
ncbi:hypothetical protein ACWEJ6_49530 [Nonomuraea sp. NPDC004702]